MPTALLSVYDKTGIAALARELHDLGWRIVSSGGTAREIAAAGVPVVDVAELTGYPAILGHRVVTLHPTVHGGLLADPDDPDHRRDLDAYGIEPISLVVVNLYPFGSDPGIDLIDIGGPAMVRAAAKNHAHVGVVVDPADYAVVIDELRRDGALGVATRRRLARTAFATTAAYDTAIVDWFDGDDPLPPTLHLAYERVTELRYGENPHQRGARYRRIGGSGWWDTVEQFGGKELSYLNVFDTEAAWRLVHRFDAPACVIVKHANPCGVALGHGDDPILDAYRAAHACDPVSAFGGIVALNRPVTEALANELAPVFTEVIVAPDYDAGARDVLAAKANLRVLAGSSPGTASDDPRSIDTRSIDIRLIDGGALVQQADSVAGDRSGWSVVTASSPTATQWDDLAFAWQVCAAVASNAIVYAKDGRAYGIGAGQQNRLDSARIAAERAAGRAVGGVAASDAFFPFRDGLDAAAAAGVVAVIQPGGSVRDAEVIAAADEHGIAMVFTGERHFRH